MTTDSTYTNYEVSPLGSILIISSVVFLIIVRLVHKIFCIKLQSNYTSLPTRKQQSATIFTGKMIIYTMSLIFGLISNQVQILFYRIFTNTFIPIDKNFCIEVATAIITVTYIYDLAVRKDLSWSVFLHHMTGLAGICLLFNLKFGVSYSFIICHGVFQLLEHPFQFALIYYALFKSSKYIMMGIVTFAFSKLLSHIFLIMLFVQEASFLETWFLVTNIAVEVFLVVTQIDTVRILLLLRTKATNESQESLKVSTESQETLKKFTESSLKECLQV